MTLHRHGTSVGLFILHVLHFSLLRLSSLFNIFLHSYNKFINWPRWSIPMVSLPSIHLRNRYIWLKSALHSFLFFKPLRIVYSLSFSWNFSILRVQSLMYSWRSCTNSSLFPRIRVIIPSCCKTIKVGYLLLTLLETRVSWSKLSSRRQHLSIELSLRLIVKKIIYLSWKHRFVLILLRLSLFTEGIFLRLCRSYWATFFK